MHISVRGYIINPCFQGSVELMYNILFSNIPTLKLHGHSIGIDVTAPNYDRQHKSDKYTQDNDI